jgi:hypothetical protein
VTDIHRLVARERRQSDAAAEMLALLRRLEWSGEDATCPSCGGADGHRDLCLIAAILRRHTRGKRRPTQAECHPDRLACARGLCRPCWVRARDAGTLGRYARKSVTEDDVRMVLSALGECTTTEAAEALEVTPQVARTWLRRFATRLTPDGLPARWRWTDPASPGVSTGDSPAAGPSRAQRVASRDQPSRRGV